MIILWPATTQVLHAFISYVFVGDEYIWEADEDTY